MNHLGYYDIPKFLMILCVSTPVFVVSGMVGLKSHLHFSLIPVAGFSILLFDRKEKIKILFAIGYPLLLLSILIATDFKLFPNLMGEKLQMLPVYDYFLNFGIIFSTMFCFYRSYIVAEDNYQVLYEEHLKAQKALDDERARAIHASKMAALGEMAGGIAHEIDSPLFVIKTLSYKLKSKAEDPEFLNSKGMDYANTIYDTCSKIGTIVRSLNSFARSTQDDPAEPVELKSLIDDTLVICKQRYYLKAIAFDVQCEKDFPKVLCRPVEIGQILINLLNNSYDAVATTKNPQVSLKVECNNRLARISVKDNGHGIPDANKDKIFLNYFTTKIAGKGTGLGLSISRRIADSNKGKLYFESQPGNTVFTLELPLA